MEQALLHSLFFSHSLYVGFSLAELIGFIYPEMMLPLLIFMYFDSLFPSVLVSLMTIYLLHCYGESLLRSTLFRLVAVLWLLFFIMLDMTLFTKLKKKTERLSVLFL